MNTEEIKTQFVTIVSDIIDIYEKTSKFITKDIDTLITNVVSLNKKNMLLKKLYDLEDNIGKLKMLITKSSLLSSIEQKENIDKSNENDPQQVNEEKDDKEDAKPKSVKKKEEKVEEIKEDLVKEETKRKVLKKKEEKEEDVVGKEKLEEATLKEEIKPKVVRKKEEKVEEITVKEETKPKVVKKKEVKVEEAKVEEPKPRVVKKKEEKVEPSKPAEIEAEESNTIDESQPLHIKRKKIPKQIKTLVWNEYVGNDIMQNKCLCCKKEKIDIRNFHCGHVIAESKGGDLTIKNLRPICAPCNLSMGSMSMNEFTKTFFGWEV